jgi:hypothetical protein
MGADGAEHGLVGFGERPIALRPRHMGRDRHHAADPGRRGRREHIRQAVGEVGEIEVAVAVDEHARFQVPSPAARRFRPP